MKVKVKEKVTEMNEWVKEHRHDIAKVCFGAGMAFLGAAVGIFYGRAAGQEEGFIDGVGVGSKSVFKMFGGDETPMTKLKNCDTGLLDALMTEEFYDVMVANSDIIHHDDGSWDFRSEVK